MSQKKPVWDPPPKPMKPGRLLIPESVELAGERLRWRFGLNIGLRRPNMALLDEFRALPLDGEPEAYLRYAKHWGPLGLCARHSLPCAHAERCLPRRRKDGYSEPLSGWRDYVAQFRAAMRLSVANEERKKCSAADWQLLGGWDGDWHPSAQSGLLAEALNRWLTLGGVRPRMILGGTPLLYMESCSDCGHGSGSFPLFGTLVWHLVLTIARSDGLGHCSGCGNTYVVVGRRPRQGVRTYCAGCRDAGTPHRDAMRALRDRRKGKDHG